MQGQAPPEVAPPSLSQSLAINAGLGNQYGMSFSQISQYNQLAQAQAGSMVGNFFGNTVTPSVVNGIPMAAMVAAPLMASARGMWPRVAASALTALDPFTYLPMAGRFGFGLAGGGSWAASTGALGAFRGALGAARGAQTAAELGQAGLGLGRAAFGVAGAGAVGLAAAAVPLAAGYAATEGLIRTGEQFFHGAHQGMVGKGLMTSIGGQFGGNQSHGVDVGRFLEEQGRDIDKSASQMADMARQMDSMKLFQTTRDVREFKERFSKIMETVKEVASTMQTSVDDALKMVSELRNQGFYTTSDIKTANLKQEARQSMSGLSLGEMVQSGRFGSQYAKALGMRGRFGSDFVQQQTANVAYAMRQGYLSEEAVMEAGGVSQVGANLAARQMRFLSTSRGRVMIANMLGSHGEMDMERVSRMLSGDMTLESMVTGAANRGLGILRQAGTARARENAMQYAGMGMISIAAAQSQQIYGGYNKRSLLSMLGTMGLSRSDATMLLNQTMALPELLEQQTSAEYSASQMADWERSRNYHKLTAGFSRYLNSGDYGFTRGLFSRARSLGAAAGGAASRTWGTVAELFGRPVTYSGGGESDLRLARKYGRTGRSLEGMELPSAGAEELASSHLFEMIGMGVSTADQGPLIGGTPSSRERIRTELRAYTVGAGEALRSGGDYVDLGDGRFITRRDMNRGLDVMADAKLTERQAMNLGRVTGGGGDIVGRARKMIVGGSEQGYEQLQSIYDTEGWSDLTREEQNAWILATAADKLSGDRKTGLRGSGDTSQFIKDKDYRTRLMAMMAQSSDLTLSGVIKERSVRSLGTVSEERSSFESRFAESLNKMSDSSSALKFGIGNVMDGIDEEDVSQLLVRDKKARASFADYLEALKSGNPEDIAAAKKALEPYDQLLAIAQRADTNKDYQAGLRKGDLLEQIGRLADSEVRGRAQARATGNARAAVGAFGGRFDEHLKKLRIGGLGISEYSKRSTAFAEDILKDRTIDKDERAILEKVFGASGSRFISGFEGLMSGDKEKVSSVGEKLNLSQDEIDMISSIQDEEVRAEQIVKVLKSHKALDPTAYSSAGGKDIGDTRTSYVEANTRFVAAVDRFVSNLKGDLGDDWKPLDQDFLDGVDY